MDIKGFAEKLKMYLADPYGKIWSEDEIYKLLDEALKQYCIDSGLFVGRFDFCPDENGIYHYPDDYAGFMIGWNNDGQEITQSSSIDLFSKNHNNFYKKGNAEYIYDDMSSYGDFKLYPENNTQNITYTTTDKQYGEIEDSGYGVFADGAYGVTLSVSLFESAGEIYYHKLANYEDVKDCMAVICYALSLAYNTDADLANAENSNFWKKQYKNRIAVTGRIAYMNTGKNKTYNFY
jgi:hypothetical protein